MFAWPDSAIAEVTKGTCRKCSLLYLELLEANDVGLRPCEPRREIMQTLVDVVDVESGDLQWSGLTRKDHSVLSRVSHCKYFVCVGRVLRMPNKTRPSPLLRHQSGSLPNRRPPGSSPGHLLGARLPELIPAAA